jgi:hypothetical protein
MMPITVSVMQHHDFVCDESSTSTTYSSHAGGSWSWRPALLQRPGDAAVVIAAILPLKSRAMQHRTAGS